MGLTTDAHQEVPDVDGVGLLPHAVDPILATGGGPSLTWNAADQ